MTLPEFVKSIVGYLVVGAGILLFSNLLKQSLKGYRSEFGTDIRGYAFSLMLFIAGGFLIYTSIFK